MAILDYTLVIIVIQFVIIMSLRRISDLTHGRENHNEKKEEAYLIRRRYLYYIKYVVIILFVVFSITFLIRLLTMDNDNPLKTKAETLPDLQSRIALISENSGTALYWSVVCSFTLVNTGIYDQAKGSNVLIYELVQKFSIILRYTTEQLILWFVIQLVLLTFLNPELSYPYTLFHSPLYFLGRFLIY